MDSPPPPPPPIRVRSTDAAPSMADYEALLAKVDHLSKAFTAQSEAYTALAARYDKLNGRFRRAIDAQMGVVADLITGDRP